ncbi:hypothetical protein [Endozoicomonas sp.]|uniref:hypothetical protein n=1 Tax=Endozoicomonas sp. TaxID=1892382 RepID=UPI003AF54EAC
MMLIKIKNFSFGILSRILCAVSIVALSPMYLSFDNAYDFINIAALAYTVYFLLSESLRLYRISGKFFLDYDGTLIRVYDDHEKRNKEILIGEVTNIAITKKFVKISTSHDVVYLHFAMMSIHNQSLFLNKIYPEIEKSIQNKQSSRHTHSTVASA